MTCRPTRMLWSGLVSLGVTLASLSCAELNEGPNAGIGDPSDGGAGHAGACAVARKQRTACDASVGCADAEVPEVCRTCARPEAGCACEAGEPPVSCYAPPVRRDGSLQCRKGTRYCREGMWSGCESLHSYVLRSPSTPGRTIAALVDGPSQCNACDVTCGVSRDYPTDADLTPDKSRDVEYVPGVPGGITLETGGTGGGSLPDADGDGVPDEYDAFPNDPTRDGFTEVGGIFHMLPFGQHAGPDALSISSQIRTADVYLLMDATGSMGGEIENLKSALTTGLFPVATAPVFLNTTQLTAHDVGVLPEQPRAWTGDTSATGMLHTYRPSCSRTGFFVNSNAPDAVFRFRLETPRSVTISTEASSFATVIGLMNSSFSEIGCQRTEMVRNLPAGDYYVIVDGYNTSDSGRYRLTMGSTGACEGVLGAIRCMIPDSWFGVGWHREYPLDPHGSPGNEVFRHELDVTESLATAQTVVNDLTTQFNRDWPESQTQALYAVASGQGLGPFLSARTGCAGERWGYPCFRDGTIPIVILFTDAPFNNGPNRSYDYSFHTPSPPRTTVSGNQNQSSAHDLGDLTHVWRSVMGSTASMSDTYGSSVVGCGANARDATFRFTLTQRTGVNITTQDSAYDTVIGLFRSSISAANRVACNNDFYYAGGSSSIYEVLDPGTYFVVVDGSGTSRGTYRMGIGQPAAPARTAPVTWQQTVQALRDRGVKVITVASCDGAGSDATSRASCPDLRTDARALGSATDSVDDHGVPFVYEINADGSGLSTAVVDAVQALANYSRMNISARARDNPSTLLFDERLLVQSLTASDCGGARCSGPHTATQCGGCLPGTTVGFQATFANHVVVPTTVAQVFDFDIELIGDGVYVLTTVPVRLVVPPVLPTFPESGAYWRDYDASTRCSGTDRPDWGTFTWSATTPADTRVRFEVQTANRLADLTGATPVSFTAPSATPPQNIGDLLTLGGETNLLPFLRVTAHLVASTDRLRAPVLEGFELQFQCLTSE